MSATHFALRFISGKYQGGEFPIHVGREIVIGRSSDLDMVLVEDMVSRKHAKISATAEEITIEDFGSTNGTFVNGEKVQKVALKEGDRILIGTSIIKLVAVDGAQMSEEAARSKLEQTGNRSTNVSKAGKPMSGSIDEIPLPDLLQLLSTSRKNGVLSVRSEIGLGKLFFRKGHVYFASIDDSFDVPPKKAFFRIMTWVSGTFELEPPDERTVADEIEESTEGMLMEAMRQMDEIARLSEELPPRDASLGLTAPLTAPLKDLKPEQLEILQLAINVGNVQAIMDQSSFTDLKTCEALHALVKGGYLTAS